MIWRCRDRDFDLTRHTVVMGIVNVTPDSFSDGGRFLDPADAVGQARRLAAEGAEIVDVGAESTRPGAARVAPEEQLRRLLPVLEALRETPELCVSVDTTSAAVAAHALRLGARAVNDVSALGDPEMGPLVARAGAGIVLMHMRGTPQTMQSDPRYDDVSAEVRAWLAARIERALAAGMALERIAVDPGIGFGKSADHNLEIIARLAELADLERPIAIGVSRKSFLGRLLDLPPDQRLEGGLAATAVAVFLGARIVRTHDVAATVRAVRIAEALRVASREAERTRA